MEEIRFVSTRENPRNLGFLPDRGPSTSSSSNNNKPMANDLIQKPPPSILDRFRALLKEREEELRVSDEDDVPPPSTEEIVRLYEVVLSELTFNSKPIITELTMIAGENREYGDGIADAICARIIEVPVEQKMPSLYLLDSIVKNIGCEYVRYFTARLPEVFCEVYRQVPPNLYPAMRHLFGTWSAVFPPSVLRKVEAELQFSEPVNHQSSGSTALRTSESPRPSHGIHVNPKYLEARHQFEHSTELNMRETGPNNNAAHMTTFGGERMERNALASSKGWSGASPKFHDIQHGSGISSCLEIYGQKPAIGYGEYDIDHEEVISSHARPRKLGSPEDAANSSFIGRGERLLPSLKSTLVRPFSPSKIWPARSLSPPNDEFAKDNSPRRVNERASPSHSGFDYGLGRVTDMDGEKSDWWIKHWSDNARPQLETSTAYNLTNGSEQQRPRALIDAYGNDKRKTTLKEKPLNVERLRVNGINSKADTRAWQNTEEEEYVWEDMSPTLADRSRGNDLMPPNPPLGSLSKRPGAALFQPNLRRGNRPSQAQLSVVDDSSSLAEDGFPILGSGHGPASIKSHSGSGFRNVSTQIQGSHYPLEAWNLPRHFPESSQQHLNPKARGNFFHMPFPASGIASSAGQKMDPLIDNFQDIDPRFQRLSSLMSRMESSSPDTLNVEVLSAVAPASMVEKHMGPRPHSSLMAPLIWPPVNVHKSHLPPLLPILPQQKPIKSQFDLIDASKTVVNQGRNKSLISPGQQLDYVERRSLTPSTMLHFSDQQMGLHSANHRNQGQAGLLQPQLLKSQEAQGIFLPSGAAQFSSHLMTPPLNHGFTPQGHGAAIRTNLSNPIPGLPSSSLTIQGIANTSFHLQGGALPPPPPVSPRASLQIGTTSQNVGPNLSHPPPGSSFSGLISSLMAQGLISLAKPDSTQDSVGVEFNPDILKVRHESAISALYANLPRQCTTCGLRFKSQEEHSSHMDWHVNKNRISKNRKQKPSRKWFVSATVWLSGAETVGTDAVPGFLPTEAVVEKRDDEEMAVPADEDQNVCALCGEPFDDFYSDETEEWMYKGAVYLNAPDGSTAGMDKSQLGPIVHAKCRSESTVVSPEDFGVNEGGNTEEGSQRKRMRS